MRAHTAPWLWIAIAVILTAPVAARAQSSRLARMLWERAAKTHANPDCSIACLPAKQLLKSTSQAARASELLEWKTFGDLRDGTFGALTPTRLPTASSARIVQQRGEEYVEFRLCGHDPKVSGGRRAELSSPPGTELAVGSLVELLLPIWIPSDGIYIDPDAPPRSTAAVLAQIKGHDGRSPPVAVRVHNNGQLAVTIDNGSGRHVVVERPLVVDRPVVIRLLVGLEPTAMGSVQATIDGNGTTFRGPVGFVDNIQGYYFKYGLYNSGPNVLPPTRCMTTLAGPMFYRIRRDPAR